MMHNKQRGPHMYWIAKSGIGLLLISVILGAFGAHALKTYTTEQGLSWWRTGVVYQTTHGFGLITLALLSPYLANQKQVQWIAWCFLGGWVLFSGSLYALTLTQIRILGAITPFGGTLWIIGWILFLVCKWDLSSPEKAGTDKELI